MSEIVVGYDGSDSSKSALKQALEFANGLGDGVVIVFGYAPGGYGGGEVPEQRRAVEEFGEKVTKEAVDNSRGREGGRHDGARQRARARGADQRRRKARRLA